MGGICFQADKTGKPYSHFISIQAFSQSAKTYDSPAVKSIFAFTSGRSNKTKASLSGRQKYSIKSDLPPPPYTAGKPNISDSCFCVYCTRTAIVFSRKGAYESFFFGIFYVNCNKTRTGNTAHRQSNNPYCYQQYTPGKSAFSDLIFLVFCQLCQTYIS